MILTESQTKTMDCLDQMQPIRDALDVISGKWKVLILTSIMHGNRRFTEIEKSLPKINAKVLANELKDLEDHQLIERMVHRQPSINVEYQTTEYAHTLKQVMLELHAWGVNHRKKIMGQ